MLCFAQYSQALEGSKALLISGTLDRLLNHMTDIQQQLFIEAGYPGLERWLEDERERKLPEILRDRPKVVMCGCIHKIVTLQICF